MSSKPITGWHVFIFVSAAFSIIIGVNITMAYFAVSTFPGLEVKNTYVASQVFDEKRAAQSALGWTISSSYADDVLEVGITDADGHAVEVQEISGILGRATHDRADSEPTFTYANGVYSTPVKLALGNWNYRMRATALDGTAFEQRVVIHVREAK
jgi:nitrogen fixation protein FixH